MVPPPVITVPVAYITAVYSGFYSPCDIPNGLLGEDNRTFLEVTNNI